MALSKITPNSFSSFSTANTNIDSGTFFVDPVNDRIGIRTSTPGSNVPVMQANNTISANGSRDYALDVRGNMRLGDLTSSEQDIHFMSANNNIWQLGSNTTGGDNGGHANIFYLYNDTGGSVGVGSASSLNKYYWTMSGAGHFRVLNQPAFSAYRAASIGNSSQSPQVIIFDTIRGSLNRGSCYSTSTGRFTAPCSGTYLFCATNNAYATAGDMVIRLNGGYITGVEYDPSGSGGWLGSSTQIILSMSIGDYVDCYWTSAAGTGQYIVEQTPWNSFSGCLLF